MLFSIFLVGAIGFFNVKKGALAQKRLPSTTTYFVADAATFFSPTSDSAVKSGEETETRGCRRLPLRSSRFRTTKRRRRRAARFLLPAPRTRPSACLLHRLVRSSPPSSRFQKTLTSHDIFAFFLFCFIMTKNKGKKKSSQLCLPL